MGNASALADFLLLLGVAIMLVGVTLWRRGRLLSSSAGNQKIALALFDAQQAHAMPSSGGASTGGATTGAPSSNSVIAPAPATASTTPAAKPMTLDQIAAQKQSGHAWGVAQTMRDQGLVQERTSDRSSAATRTTQHRRDGGHRRQGQVAGARVERP